jgi:hypothetical protein
MPRHARAALAAAMVVAAFTLTPAAAAERATLKVTARVVDRCTVAVPSRISPGLWQDRQHLPARFLRHECQSDTPFWVDARQVLIEPLRERFWAQVRYDGGRVHEVRHPQRDDVVLITVTY